MDLSASRVSPQVSLQLKCRGSQTPTAKVGMLFRSHGLTYRVCFPTFLSDRSGFKESDNKSGNFELSNTNVAGTVLVFTSPSNVREKSSSSMKDAQSIGWSKSGKSCVSRERKLKTPGMYSFPEKLSSEGLSKESISLITNARRKGTSTHYESS